SSAHTAVEPLTYITPSTTIGVTCNPVNGSTYVHASCRRATVCVEICVRSLCRLPLRRPLYVGQSPAGGLNTLPTSSADGGAALLSGPTGTPSSEARYAMRSRRSSAVAASGGIADPASLCTSA